MPGPLLDEDLRRRIAGVRARMHAESHCTLRMTELARQACLSEQHFTRLFRASYGVSPGRYLAQLRVMHAKTLLARDRSVTEVCLSIGYSSVSTFSRRFALETSLSPSAYQRQLRGFGAVPDRLVALYIPACFLSMYGAEQNVRNG